MRRRTAIVASVLALMVAALGVTSGTAFAAKSKSPSKAQRAKKPTRPAPRPARKPAPKPAPKPTSTTKPPAAADGSGKPADERRPKEQPSGERSRPPKSSDGVPPRSEGDRPKPAGEFRCAAGYHDGAPAAHCRWTATENASFGSYRLWRAEPNVDRQVIFTTTDRGTTTYTDRTVVEGKSYGYALELLDKDGRSMGHSEMVKVTCCAAGRQSGKDQMAAVQLECRAGTPEGRPAAACRWTASDSPAFGGYRLWRATDDANKQVVFTSRDRGETQFLDRDVRNGTEYAYAVEVLDQDGRPIGRSQIVRVRCCEPSPTTTSTTTGS